MSEASNTVSVVSNPDVCSQVGKLLTKGDLVDVLARLENEFQKRADFHFKNHHRIGEALCVAMKECAETVKIVTREILDRP